MLQITNLAQESSQIPGSRIAICRKSFEPVSGLAHLVNLSMKYEETPRMTSPQRILFLVVGPVLTSGLAAKRRGFHVQKHLVDPPHHHEGSSWLGNLWFVDRQSLRKGTLGLSDHIQSLRSHLPH